MNNKWTKNEQQVNEEWKANEQKWTTNEQTSESKRDVLVANFVEKSFNATIDELLDRSRIPLHPFLNRDFQFRFHLKRVGRT